MYHLQHLVVVEKVRHLEVSMDDPSAVQVLDRLQQLEHNTLDLHSKRTHARTHNHDERSGKLE